MARSNKRNSKWMTGSLDISGDDVIDNDVNDVNVQLGEEIMKSEENDMPIIGKTSTATSAAYTPPAPPKEKEVEKPMFELGVAKKVEIRVDPEQEVEELDRSPHIKAAPQILNKPRVPITTHAEEVHRKVYGNFIKKSDYTKGG